MLERLNHDAYTILEARNYITNRAVQMLRLDYKLLFIQNHEWGVNSFFKKDDKIFQAIYILKPFRGTGIYKKYVKHTIVTSWDCGIERYLGTNNIDHVIEDLNPYAEYYMIANYYGFKTTKRTGVYYMNHVDEGLAILEWIGASHLSKKAYAIHPIYQGDEDLAYNKDLYEIDPKVMLRAIEYRSVANEYLSQRTITSLDEIRLSPLKDVNDMLIADKVQNRKDFELYHYGKHPRSKELMEYFINWLTKLGISEEQYQEFKNKLG